MLFNFIMLFLKQSLLFVCAILALTSCSTMRHQNYKSNTDKFGWHVDNDNQKKSNTDDLSYYLAIAEFGDLICLEVGNGNPVCFEVEQRVPTILDTEEEPYLLVTIYEPSEVGRHKITNYASLRELLSE